MGRTTMQARGRFKISLLFVVLIMFVLATCTISYYLTSYYHVKSSLIAGVTNVQKSHYINIQTWEGRSIDFSPVKSTRKVKRIIYNRVGKCGSRTMIQLMISLTGKLNYTVIGSTKNNILHLNLREQTFDECVKNEMKECVDPQRILYIIPYFCGHEAFCRRPTELALRQAKINVIKNYLVVGVTEELEDFLFVLERLLPEFFSGVLNIYRTPDDNLNSKMTSTKTVNKIGPSPEVQQIMKKHLQLEYDFYEFVKERFHRLKAELR
ncbi:hypothetical protein pdam_00004589 [Pocillopora damicornis]|uniref:Uncharacterized protein n=1 Tax=Pocillopora damicornis TaxID=46731 RepID=A0A3M6ULV5_POCDA|nr:hypothetical protein pdam_00004589 [Pocillopora damicornis]